jgi:ABC-2 type transport system permease protein
MSGLRLFAHQFRSDLLRFWRNPQSRYFTLLLPVVFLVIFESLFKGFTVVDGRRIAIITFYVPAIMTLGIISASFVNLTQAIVTQRENGEYKRLRGTPLPAAFVIGSRALVGVVVAVLMSALLLAIGGLAYGVSIPRSTMPALVLAVVVGAAVFACVAFALVRLISTTEAAPPATNLMVLPLYFISGVFVPESQIPRFLHDIAVVFPIYHLSRAVRLPFVHAHGAAVAGSDLLVLAAWGLAALLIAARTFEWSPVAAGQGGPARTRVVRRAAPRG